MLYVPVILKTINQFIQKWMSIIYFDITLNSKDKKPQHFFHNMYRVLEILELIQGTPNVCLRSWKTQPRKVILAKI